MIIILSTGGYVWVAQKTPVEYVDENGETQTCTDYTTANYAGFAWSGWIVVHEDVYLDGRVETEGDVHLILEDGKTIGIRGGIHVSEDISIEIFGQTGCTGTLNADMNPTDFQFFFIELGVSKASAIGSNEWNSVAESNGPIVINGGVINATGFNAPGIGVANGNYPSGDITINGGVVTAAGKNNLAAGIGSGWGGPRVENTGKITINGGEVHATGLVGKGDGSSGGEIVTINGGVVEADGIGTRGDGTFGVPTTINGGVVTIHAAGGSLGGVTGGSPSVNNRVTFTVNGGQLISDVPIGSAASDIFLGWTNKTDFIQVPSYTGVVTLTDDWAVDGSDETFAAGAVSDNSTLSNKKLIPLIPEPVEPIETSDLHIYNSISVGTDMVITFTARKNDLTNYNNFWIEVVKHNPDGDVTYTYDPDVMTEGSSTWSVQFKHIYAKEMGVDVEARLCAENAAGQVFMSPVRNANIRDYLGGRLTATNNSVEQRVLAADMLNYGAAAQMFTDFQTDHLVNEELTAEQLAKLHQYETTTLPLVEKTNTNYRPQGASNILFTSVTLGNEVLLNLTIRLAEGTEGVQVLVKNHETGAVVTTLDTVFLGSTFNAAFNGIGANKMRTEYDLVTIVNGVETGNTRTWSVEAYVGEIRAEGIPLKVAMANALLTYGDSAAAYLWDGPIGEPIDFPPG